MKVIRKHYDNGQLNVEYTVNKNGKMHGKYKMWRPSGQLWIQSNYKDGERHGEHKWWWDNGQLYELLYYKDDELHGEFKCWSKNGRLLCHLLYENGNCIKDYLKK